MANFSPWNTLKIKLFKYLVRFQPGQIVNIPGSTEPLGECMEAKDPRLKATFTDLGNSSESWQHSVGPQPEAV